MSRAEKYHKDAAECRELADKAMSPIDKAHWLELADHGYEWRTRPNDIPTPFRFLARHRTAIDLPL